LGALTGDLIMKKLTTIIFLFLAANLFAQFGPSTTNIETYVSQANAYPGSTVKIAVKVKIDETWHINSNKPNDEFLIPTELIITSQQELRLNNIRYPKAKDIPLAFSDTPVSVFEGVEFIYADLVLPNEMEEGDISFEVKLNYQACNNESCLPPNTATSNASISIVGLEIPIESINSELFTNITLNVETESTTENDSIASTIESSGLLLGIIIVFLGGLALNLTPCVYPLIPITVGYFGGQAEGKTSRLFVLGSVYVLGMALTYSIIGVVTSLSGAVFGTLLQNPIVIIAIAVILLALSLSMFGVYEFKLPDSLVAKAGGAKSGLFGSFFMGLTLGIVAAPCIGPFVIGLLTVVAAKGDVFYGFIMFFFLAIGLGSPYLVLAMFSGKIKTLPRAGFWMEGVKHIFGFLLVGMAIFFLGPILPKELTYYLLPIFMIVAAIYLMFVDKMGNDVTGFKVFKYIFSIVIIALGSYMLYPTESKSPDWNKYTDAIYEEAIDTNQPLIIDFYADWCIPCKELDALTFSDDRVIKKSEEFVNIKVDMTKTMSDETERIRNKFKIVGMPTVLIIDSQGEEIHRITGFVNSDEFLELLSDVN
jgi:thiol:disulfide interchange protein DsbD